MMLAKPVSKLNILYFRICIQRYTGANCTTQCPYPTYGEECQETCNCSVDICDRFWACKSPTTLTAGRVL